MESRDGVTGSSLNRSNVSPKVAGCSEGEVTLSSLLSLGGVIFDDGGPVFANLAAPRIRAMIREHRKRNTGGNRRTKSCKIIRVANAEDSRLGLCQDTRRFSKPLDREFCRVRARQRLLWLHRSRSAFFQNQLNHGNLKISSQGVRQTDLMLTVTLLAPCFC
jgi:hypothetical protein